MDWLPQYQRSEFLAVRLHVSGEDVLDVLTRTSPLSYYCIGMYLIDMPVKRLRRASEDRQRTLP